MSIASFRDRLLDFRSCWIAFIHTVQGCPGGSSSSPRGEAVKIFLASVLQNVVEREKSCAWTTTERRRCFAVHLISFHTLQTRNFTHAYSCSAKFG